MTRWSEVLPVSSGAPDPCIALGLCSTDRLETRMRSAKPAPVGRALLEAVATAMRAWQPPHALAATPRAWLACGGTAGLVTHALGWARCERASLGTSARAALAWRCRPSKRPWDHLLRARVRVLRRHPGLPAGRRGIDATAHQRSHAAKARAHRSTRRAQARGGALWGPRLVWLFLVSPPSPSPWALSALSPPLRSRQGRRRQSPARSQTAPHTSGRPNRPPRPGVRTHFLKLRLI